MESFCIQCKDLKEAKETIKELKEMGLEIDTEWNKWVDKESKSMEWNILYYKEPTCSKPRAGIYIHNLLNRRVLSLEDVRKELGLSKSLPIRWAVRVTPENADLLTAWKKKVSGGVYFDTAKNYTHVTNNGSGHQNDRDHIFEEITFEQFLKKVLATEGKDYSQIIGNQIIHSGAIPQTLTIVEEECIYKTIKVNGKTRDISLVAIVAGEGEVFTGYAVRHPDDKKDFHIARDIALKRAVGITTNLTRFETISRRFHTKKVLKGILKQVLSEIKSGAIPIKGVK